MNHHQLLITQVSRRIGTLTKSEEDFITKNWQTFTGAPELAQEIQELRTPLMQSIECRRNDGQTLTQSIRVNSPLRLA